MSSIIKVDQIQLSDGSTPTAGDLGLNLSRDDFPSETVIGFAQRENSTYVQFSTDTLTLSENYVDYTPKSSNSTIIVTAYFQAYKIGQTSGGSQGAMYRDNTRLQAQNLDWVMYQDSADRHMAPGCRTGISTGHTAGTQYRFALKIDRAATTNFYIYASAGFTTVLEIAG